MTPAMTAAARDGWLTTVLRPAGELGPAALGRLSAALSHLAASSDMVIVDLTAADVGNPRTLAMSLRAPAREFDRTGRCLLMRGVSPRLAAELDRAAVPVITLGADAVPDPAA